MRGVPAWCCGKLSCLPPALRLSLPACGSRWNVPHLHTLAEAERCVALEPAEAPDAAPMRTMPQGHVQQQDDEVRGAAGLQGVRPGPVAPAWTARLRVGAHQADHGGTQSGWRWRARLAAGRRRSPAACRQSLRPLCKLAPRRPTASSLSPLQLQAAYQEFLTQHMNEWDKVESVGWLAGALPWALAGAAPAEVVLLCLAVPLGAAARHDCPPSL